MQVGMTVLAIVPPHFNQEIVKIVKTKIVDHQTWFLVENKTSAQYWIACNAIVEKLLDQNHIIREIASVSSGTLAGVFNTNSYAEIDAILEDLVSWVKKQNKTWTSWQDVVLDYKNR